MSSDLLDTNVIVLLSGGIDSSACAKFYVQQEFRVEALFIDFMQPAATNELSAATKIADYLSIPLKVAVLRCQFSLPQNEILGRNAFFILTALMYLPESKGIISMGIHSGTPYYDCSPEFISYMQILIDGYAGGCISIGAPFLKWNKLHIWRYAVESGLPLEDTYSCELGLSQPCGGCRSCQDLERLHAG